MARDQVHDDGSYPRADYRPAGTDTRVTTFATLKRTLQEFSEDNLSVWAAALTYIGLFPVGPERERSAAGPSCGIKSRAHRLLNRQYRDELLGTIGKLEA